MLGFIPSPAHGIVHLGPLELHAYGLMLAIGVLVAAKIAEVRWRRTGHDPKVITEIAVPVVVVRCASAPAFTTCSPATSGAKAGSPARSRSGRAASRSGAR